MLEKTLESPLDCKEIQPVNPKGKQPWIFIGRTDAEAEAPILWPSDAKKTDSLVKKKKPWWLKAKGKTEGKRRREWQRMRWLDSITDSKEMNLSKLWAPGKDEEAWRAAVLGVDWATAHLRLSQQPPSWSPYFQPRPLTVSSQCFQNGREWYYSVANLHCLPAKVRVLRETSRVLRSSDLTSLCSGHTGFFSVLKKWQPGPRSQGLFHILFFLPESLLP